jgi:hypothetical protein
MSGLPVSLHWAEDCEKWRGRLLTGKYAHWCLEWDDLPIDETTPEWPCHCGIQEHVDGKAAEAEDAARSVGRVGGKQNTAGDGGKEE